MICAVVLAAGQSRRMGTQKLLLPFGDQTVIEHVVDRLLNCAIDEVFVVAGHEGHRIAEKLSGRPLSVVPNPGYREGMLSSIRAGLRALPRQCGAVLAALGDQPGITTELVDKMVQSFDVKDKGIVVPVYQGRRGHPLLFSTRYRDEILTDYDDVGLRGLLHAHPDDVHEMSVSSPGVLSDMDFPEDYRRALSLLRDDSAGGTEPNETT